MGRTNKVWKGEMVVSILMEKSPLISSHISHANIFPHYTTIFQSLPQICLPPAEDDQLQWAE